MTPLHNKVISWNLVINPVSLSVLDTTGKPPCSVVFRMFIRFDKLSTSLKRDKWNCVSFLGQAYYSSFRLERRQVIVSCIDRIDSCRLQPLLWRVCLGRANPTRPRQDSSSHLFFLPQIEAFQEPSLSAVPHFSLILYTLASPFLLAQQPVV